MRRKAIVVFSGGQDSTTCLIDAILRYDGVKAVSFDYGQRNHKELNVAKKIAEDFGVEHIIVDMNLNGVTTNAMTDHNMEIKVDELPNTFVAGRNQLFLTYASIIAYENDARTVITGVSDTESSGYPDCSREFIDSFQKTISLALGQTMKVETPLMDLNKSEVWAKADGLGYLEYVWENTITCYNGEMKQGCGDCPSCKLRNKALENYIVTQERYNKAGANK